MASLRQSDRDLAKIINTQEREQLLQELAAGVRSRGRTQR